MKAGREMFLTLCVAMIGLAVLFTACPKANNNTPAAVPALSGFMRAELQKAERIDFIKFKGEWCVVVVNKFRYDSDGSIFVNSRFGAGFDIYPGVDSHAAQIGEVVRWEEGAETMTMPPIGHTKWTIAAREFVLQP